MATIGETARDYEPKHIKNIAELEEVSVDLVVQEKTDVEFPYKYVLIDGDEYKVPNSILKDLKVQLEENPDLKKFKVKKSGEGLNTDYTLIILE